MIYRIDHPQHGLGYITSRPSDNLTFDATWDADTPGGPTFVFATPTARGHWQDRARRREAR